MRLTVLGPTGGTGEQLIRQALGAGHQVTAVARRPEAVTIRDAQLTVLAGDVLDPGWEGAGIQGAQAVLSALGGSDLRRPTSIYSAGVEAVLAVMQVAGVSRFIGVSAAPVSPVEEKTRIDRYVAHPMISLFFGAGYEDMAKMEAILAGSRADWTLFRPPRLTSGPASGYRTSVGRPLGHAWNLRRADLAAAMLAAIEDRLLIGKSVNIAN